MNLNPNTQPDMMDFDGHALAAFKSRISLKPSFSVQSWSKHLTGRPSVCQRIKQLGLLMRIPRLCIIS